ncbi:hypothetical protein ACFX14_003072 [Malus domestica]
MVLRRTRKETRPTSPIPNFHSNPFVLCLFFCGAVTMAKLWVAAPPKYPTQPSKKPGNSIQPSRRQANNFHGILSNICERRTKIEERKRRNTPPSSSVQITVVSRQYGQNRCVDGDLLSSNGTSRSGSIEVSDEGWGFLGIKRLAMKV